MIFSREMPSIKEFLSYIFNFQGIILGPMCYYRDYIEFINGNNILKGQVKFCFIMEIIIKSNN